MAIPVRAPKPREAKLFRNNRSQAVRIPAEFELPGERVLIHREGTKLIIEPVTKPTNVAELLAQWRTEGGLGPEDEFPEIADPPTQPEVELLYGCAKKGSAKLLDRVESIGANDLLIGAHAHALGLTLVTDNIREFQRIRGLALENWLAE